MRCVTVGKGRHGHSLSIHVESHENVSEPRTFPYKDINSSHSLFWANFYSFSNITVVDLIYTVLCPSVSNTWHLVNPNVVFVPGGEGTAAQRSACGWFPCMSCSARPTSYADQCSLLEMIFLSLLCMIEYCSIGAWMSHIFLHDPNTSWSCGQLRF